MPPSNSKQLRWSIPAPRAPAQVVKELARRTDFWIRAALCAITALVMWAVTSGWSPAFPYRTRDVPLRDMHARAGFSFDDAEATIKARQNARRNALCFYQNDERELQELREALVDRVIEIKSNGYEDIDAATWQEFLPAAGSVDGETAVESFTRFRQALENDQALEKLRNAIEIGLREFVKNGLLETLQHDLGDGSSQQIMVYPTGNIRDAHPVEVSKVRIAEAVPLIHASLRREIELAKDAITDPQFVADRVFDWLQPKLQPTLEIDKTASEQARQEKEDDVPPQMKDYRRGDPLEKKKIRSGSASIIAAGQPLDVDDIQLLRAEHLASVQQLSLPQRLIFALADLGMYAAIFCLLCGYLYYRDRRLIDDLRQFATLLGLFLITLCVAWVVSINVQWRAESIPILIFAMTVAIAYNRELALLLSALVSLVFSISHGYGMDEFVILMGTAAAASLLCGTIRSRTKLVYVGLLAAAVAFPTTIGVATMMGQSISGALLLNAIWYAGCALLAGLLMTALLPFLEQWFEIQTDISLLELSDASHPLLKQLVQRAPGTYNHSINVASIAESAAESIGANGLLCRVGAYFHDIGKMRKPEYFVENQARGDDKHADLVPTMSTLVIIAHVKEGAEMARRHHLPQPIIDMIEQHHGTTLVEYFYREAAKKREHDVDAPEVDEADFRYPGPKPRTLEAAVMMLADAVESASRALREPTPSRLEHLVKELLKKRLDDGQFDQCALTLKQLHVVEDSLIKSLNAMYHARVKYPDQQTA